MEPKRLYRSISDRKFAGVAGGLAEYFVIDPLLIRLAFVVLTLAGGGGFLIYLILWIVTPENPVRFNPAASSTAPGYKSSEPGYQPSGTSYSEPAQGSASYESAAPGTSNQPQEPYMPQTRERNKGSLIGGMVLITLGALFLADELIPNVDFGDLWPVILIVIGIGLLINAIVKRNSGNSQI
jgi:phage shock protein PspC (stress-responsive transcriptional regulator)